MKKRRAFCFILLFLIFLPGIFAQTTGNMTSSQFDTSTFPQWARDLRRGEIIAFGAFPFAYFFANFSFDTYRWSNNGWDRRYAPWPIKGAAAIEQSQSEKFKVIGIAAGGACLIALVDYGIVRYKRSQKEKESRSLPAGTPIIIRTPLSAQSGRDNPVDINPAIDNTVPETESP